MTAPLPPPAQEPPPSEPSSPGVLGHTWNAVSSIFSNLLSGTPSHAALARPDVRPVAQVPQSPTRPPSGAFSGNPAKPAQLYPEQRSEARSEQYPNQRSEQYPDQHPAHPNLRATLHAPLLNQQRGAPGFYNHALRQGSTPAFRPAIPAALATPARVSHAPPPPGRLRDAMRALKRSLRRDPHDSGDS